MGSTIRVLAVVLGVSFPIHGAFGSTAQAEIPVPKDFVYRTAKGYVLCEFAQAGKSIGDVIPMEDNRSGILRFRYRDKGFRDDDALIEVIDLDPTRSRIRVTIPKDFTGRDEHAVEQIVQSATRRYEGKEGKELPFEAKRAFQSVRRYILKEFVTADRIRGQVILMEDEEVGLIRFVYTESSFRDSEATAQIFPAGAQTSRLVVSLPADPTVRQEVFGNRLKQAITQDLTEDRRSEPK